MNYPMLNSILDTDSYKQGHYLAYPEGMQYLSTYGEARSTQRWHYHMMVGLQAWLKTLTPITQAQVEYARELMTPHCGLFNYEGWTEIVNRFGGVLPVAIDAIPEGMIVPVGTPVYQLRNTQPGFGWLPQYLETPLLRGVWYPSTVGTLSWHVKQTIRKALELSCDDPESQLMFRMHDFGARGVSSAQSAALGGLAHLVNFSGSDTVPALIAARDLYDCDMAAYNIPALEHSTICAWGEEREVQAYSNAIDKLLLKGGLLSIVPDAYDYRHAVDVHLGQTLKDKILNSGGTVVIRPDSGVPEEEVLFALRSLAKNFGYTTNKKGYVVLHPCVRIIQGDGMNEESVARLYSAITLNGFSAENVAVGMGGGLLQGINRDTLGWAQKANAVSSGHEAWIGIQKKPATASSKTSKKGVQAVYLNDDGIAVTAPQSEVPFEKNILRPVWAEGVLMEEQTLDDVRACSNRYRLTTELYQEKLIRV